ncbi:MAG TPA: ABC transporter ATP-binding protein [Streptosporangiaceae bacterium]|nr:ABC transporter ATP-binding protein [Streptosporangiaceae bacterium]
MTSLTVTDLHVRGPHGPIVAGLNLTVEAGETHAIVGESGSGKSVSAKALTGLLPPELNASGALTISGAPVPLDGRDNAWHQVRGSRITLLPQDPFTSLSPRHRCGNQIGAVLGHLPRRERVATVLASLEEVGLPARVARQYPFQLSGGMRQRVAIAAALITGPNVLIADEATSALDVTTQRDVLDLLARLQQDREMGLILITHDLGVARGRADEVTVMYAGRTAEHGPATEVIASPAHPYTGRLLDCDPPLDAKLERLPTIPGSVPRLAAVGDACTFASRCNLVTDECRTQIPPLAEVGAGHQAACLRIADFLRESGSERTYIKASAAAREPAPSDAILSVRDLKKSFGSNVALAGIELDVAAGESVAVVGESGSGKTTLARIIVGLETADAGNINVASPPGSQDSGPRPPQIVFQDPYSALNPSLTVGTSLRDALRAGGRDRSDGQVAELLEMVGLPAAYARRRPKALSGGERQRVAIARALAPRPDMLVCDEAVSSLDVSVQAQILNLISDLRSQLGLAVLFISHDLAVVLQAAERVYVLYEGRIVEHGDTADVLARPEHDYTKLLMASASPVLG